MRSLFELSVAIKYLIPRKKQLSVSLIGLLAVVVISIVVWLVLVFLSVTEGIERNWLQKLTTLNAPLRITPTEHYLSSYYHQIDELSARSEYTSKSIAAKEESPTSDPYDPNMDGPLPARLPAPDLSPDGSLKDPVKSLFSALTQLKHTQPDLVYQDFELSGALMRLQLLRRNAGNETQGYLTQVSYLATLPDRCPGLPSLLLPPTAKDLSHLLYLASHTTDLSRQDSPALTLKTHSEIAKERIKNLLRTAEVRELKPRALYWQIPLSVVPEKAIFEAEAQFRDGTLSRIDIPTGENFPMQNKVKLYKEDGDLFLKDPSGRIEKIPRHTPLLSKGPLQLHVEDPSQTDPTSFKIRGYLQGALLQGVVNLQDLEIVQADFSKKGAANTPWIAPNHTSIALPTNEEKETGVLLAKSFLDQGIMIGDRGYLSYSSTTSSSLQEQRLPIFVSGFYDPGILSVGNKCILVPPFITHAINASNSSFNLDKTQSSGVLVWFNDLNQAEVIKNQIQRALTDLGIDRYWKVTTFRNYDFAKDLLEQFQSDKYLFAIVGILILIVACCNIISMLVLLVNDKKQEIGILQAMGATRLSIATIFGVCGIVMGIISSIVGTCAALFTLKHIDSLIQLLSYFQGHDTFNPTFFGSSLPDKLSGDAVTFILIATPLISLLAGLVPAIKACRLQPSEILRAE
jgi:lipoprotein-releasing system permease protein